MSSDVETRNDEIAADVPLPEEEPEGMGSDQPQGGTEESFFTVPPGARQVRHRKEVKMRQLTPAEKRTTMSAHRLKHMSETLSEEEYTTLMAKLGELNWSATQSMIQLLAP